MKKIYIFFSLILLVLTTNAQVVINEVYGGGGNSGSTYTNDFIELYNNSSSAVSLAGWSVQYASAAATGTTTWAVTTLTGSIPANGYYLVQEAKGTGGTVALPAPDAAGTIAMSATAGRVALVNGTTALVGCPASASYVDLVGFGLTATCYEGTGPTPAPSNTTSVQRLTPGADNNDNKTDFAVGAPSPLNSAGPDVTPPTLSSVFPANGATDVATTFTGTITFSEPVIKGSSGNITIRQVSNDAVVENIDITGSSVYTSGVTANFPVDGLSLSTAYYIEVSSGAFTDLSSNAYPGFSGSSTWSFTTTATLPMGVLGTTYNFNTCSATISDGFTAYSVAGAEVWGCTTFGRNPADSVSAAAAPSAVQINGYSNGTNQINEDWLISPSYDLTTSSYPLLNFYSRNAFNGAPLTLKVSTDYSGTGDPTLATWTDLNGKFPGQATNVWSPSLYINLSNFKSAHTYFAFVYRSTTEDGARWTIDDVTLYNSATPPPTSISLNTNGIQYGYVPTSTSSVKTFQFTGNDITDVVTLTASANFLISKTNSNFTPSISYTQSEANNVNETVYVQFTPTVNSTNYNGNVTISTAGVNDTTVSLTGNSIDDALTLEVVNWNMEWFGSSDPTLGPTNKDQQEANAKKIITSIGADLFTCVEVVDEARFSSIVDTLNSVYGADTYGYVICDYGSHTNPFEAGHGSVATDAQKEAFIYKKSVITPISTSALVTDGVNTAADLNNPAYNYFSSGRYPFMMLADVTLGGVTKQVRFVALHAKANTSPTTTSYNRRKAGADTLNYTLNTLYPTDNIVLLGDFNDDLDQSITAGFTISSYVTFNNDTQDFFSPTLALSLAGKKSTVSYNDMIDHVELSNEMSAYYMQNTAAVLTDVASLVTNYGTTTSDHYPIFTRYAFDAAILPVNLVSFIASKQSNVAVLSWKTSQEINSKSFDVQRSSDSRNWQSIGNVLAKGNNASGNTYTLTDAHPLTGINYYRLQQLDNDGKVQYSLIRSVQFDLRHSIILSPNPAKDFVNVSIENLTGTATVDVLDLSGKAVYTTITSVPVFKINTSTFARGNYFIRIKNADGVITKQLLIQ
ncbi:MAG: lamin tail domain-containing protein [Ferruginibacter sp.]